MIVFFRIISSFIDHPTIRSVGSIGNHSQKIFNDGLPAPSECGFINATQGKNKRVVKAASSI
jgi:hypothetical protein